MRDKADELASRYREQVAVAAGSAPAGQQPVLVSLFDSATPQPFTSGRTAADRP
ncbi:hypothetical protein [Nocardia abscessus]|uniref:hypothetical protein n=1 Tax=Nocardia abscessus TaxID=120957 RepID=UPI0002D32242|nr:hypothetical protein [Nocardia abscessus]